MTNELNENVDALSKPMEQFIAKVVKESMESVRNDMQIMHDDIRKELCNMENRLNKQFDITNETIMGVNHLKKIQDIVDSVFKNAFKIQTNKHYSSYAESDHARLFETFLYQTGVPEHTSYRMYLQELQKNLSDLTKWNNISTEEYLNGVIEYANTMKEKSDIFLELLANNRKLSEIRV